MEEGQKNHQSKKKNIDDKNKKDNSFDFLETSAPLTPTGDQHKTDDSFGDQSNRKSHYYEIINHMPLGDKIYYSKQKIKEFLIYCEKEFYKSETDKTKKEILISFSGGKDSTVLFDLVIKVHKEIKSKIYLIPAYAMEITFPETIKFIKNTISKYQAKCKYLKNLLLVPPKEAWSKILKNRGYPIFSKQISVMINRVKRSNTPSGITRWIFGIKESARFRLAKNRLFLLDDDMTYYLDENNNRIQYIISEKCCDYVKGGLKHDKRPSFTGVMASESLLRKKSWLKNGCNIYSKNHLTSRPLSIWTNNNVWEYIKKFKLEVNVAYGYDPKNHNVDNLLFTRLGCSACPFGSQMEEAIHERILKNGLVDTKKYWNRFEKLYEYNPMLYQTQVMNTKIFYILIDMNIKIRNDQKYMQIYYERRKRIDEWYKDFRTNLIKVMIRIESNPHNKQKWKYKIEEFNKALAYFNEPKTNYHEIKALRKKI
ncbi:MAG: phosphoadenosine phosphosulfate reductase family protein [Malacoplasma sp.]|nr:phosphoadenosine phosphosulfate reductase family protein [Malacoplasma sp.]